MAQPVIAFLTDYGLDDDFVGTCHAVIARRCPQARVIDLSHAVPRQDAAAGARTLVRALPYLPQEAIVLAVVDPGVGGPRRPVAVRASDGRRLVGPDNGLLWPAVAAAGGPAAVVDLAASPWALAPVSATFHGRDLFAPVAAALAAGEPLERAGAPLEPASLVPLELSRARVEPGVVSARVVAVDAFGNLELDAEPGDLGAAGLDRRDELSVGGERVRVGRTFADVAPGEPVVLVDGHGALAVAVNRGSAAQRLDLGPGAELRIAAP